MKLAFNKYWAVFRDIPGIKQLLFAYDFPISLQDFEKSEEEWQCMILNRSMSGMPVLRPALVNVLKSRREFIKSKREETYKLSDKMRESGVPFSERSLAIKDRLAALDAMEKELRFYLNHKILPVKEWLILEDLRSIGRLGLERFLQINLKKIYGI